MPSISERFACSSAVRFLGERKNPRTRSSSGTGQIHPQNARPTASTSTAMMTMDTTARGTTVLVAIMVASAPSGHNAENVSQPKPESVPMLTPAISPADSTTKTAAATMVRSLFEFIAASYSVDSIGLTTMARSCAPDTMDPAFSDTHTLSHAPHPLHLSASTDTCGLAPSPVSSMAS